MRYRSSAFRIVVWRFALLSLLVSASCLRPAFAQAPAPNPPQTVHGWLVHWPDPAYLDRVLAAAPRYGVNHLELSHDIIMQIDEATENAERGRLIESVAKRAKAQGIKTFVWAHEINTRDKNAPLDPESPAGKAFWEGRREAYRRTLAACPSVEGVVLMFGSSPLEVWDRPSTPGQGDGWQRRTPAERIRFITDLVGGVVREEAKKALFVRDFNHGPAQLASILEALKNDRRITIISKAEPQDFQPFYPHSFTLGAYGATPQIVEIDLCGEYWGQSVIPISLAEYLPFRLKYDQGKGTVGAVGRVDCYSNSALGTPAELNLHAFRRALTDRDITADRIHAEWIENRYRLKPGSAGAAKLTGIYTRSWTMAKKMYYTLGFWTWKSQSSIPENSRSIDGGIAGKSSALWDPAQKATEQRLIRPDGATFREIAAEKAEAVALARENLAALPSLKQDLSAADYAEWERYLALTVDLARTYEAFNLAYWRLKLAEHAPADPDAARSRVREAIDSLTPLSDHLSLRWADLRAVVRQVPRLKAFQADLRARFERLPSATP
ncbi:MAG: hypothetical protein SFU56_08750 [Capsulimonadales bacterium]|nr:hypothetical protein [Capsulimonadales bacterium]